MHPLNQLVTQARDQEIARTANHPSRLLSHDLRLARRNTRAVPARARVLAAALAALP